MVQQKKEGGLHRNKPTICFCGKVGQQMPSTEVLYHVRLSVLGILLMLLGCGGADSFKSDKQEITVTDGEQIQQILQCVNKPLQCVVHRKGFDYYLPIGKCGEV